MPSSSSMPSPPAPITAAIAITPTFMTTAVRIPPKITGSAIGISTQRRRCQNVIPMPRPASRRPSGRFSNAVCVLRTIGSNEYRKTAVIAGSAPIPFPISEKSGIIRPNNAIVGMVSTTVAMPSTGVASHLKRTIKIPRGTPITIAHPTATSTSQVCCQVSVSRLFQLSMM
ncbi:hypothetical protein PAJ_1305 [Pantoea ananatis AJ13355]|uniref:Uncharacterized protein n=1 Tax=Pantoea ananatis (strain AJ13355) TaxID=932677 RepID=A0A0H3L0I6_PANAA|nr:hypothetical protein PAJ_1305 [Pantoea ananatis AJ13355]